MRPEICTMWVGPETKPASNKPLVALSKSTQRLEPMHIFHVGGDDIVYPNFFGIFSMCKLKK